MRPAGYPHPIPARCSSEIGALTMRYTNSHRQIASDDAQLFFDRFHPNHHFLSWSPTNQHSNTPPHRHEHAMHAHQRLVDSHIHHARLCPTRRPRGLLSESNPPGAYALPCPSRGARGTFSSKRRCGTPYPPCLTLSPSPLSLRRTIRSVCSSMHRSENALNYV